MINENESNDSNNSKNIELTRVGVYVDNYCEFINTSATKLHKDFYETINNYKRKKKELKKELGSMDEKEKLDLQIKEKEIFEDKINDILDKYGKDYNIYSKASTKIKILYSIIHFLAMSEIYGVLTPLYAELKRSIDFKLNNNKYNTNKTFKDFFKKSIYRDTSQINLNFLSALFSQYLINIFGIKKVYLISILTIFITMLVNSFNAFLEKEDIEKERPYKIGQLIYFLILYLFIYFPAGIIAFVPVQIYEYDETTNFRNCLYMLFSLTFAVILKNYFHFYFGYFINSIRLSLVLCSFLFLFFSLIYLRFLYKSKTSTKKDNDKAISDSEKKRILNYDITNNNDDSKNEDLIQLSEYVQNTIINDNKILIDFDNKMESNDNKELIYTASYNLGYLYFEFKKMSFGIKINNKCEYFKNYFNWKFILLLLINFCSRFQKVKFKTDLKDYFEYLKNDDYCLFLLIVIFLTNYIITFLLLFALHKNKYINEQEKNNYLIYKQEKFIIYLIIIVDFILMSFSYINMILENSFKGNITIWALAISGNINYLYYVFYSTKKRQFISMSGYFAISSFILKIIEMIKEPFYQMYWFRVQILSSLLGVFFSFFAKNIIDNEYKYLIKKEEYVYEDFKRNKKKYKRRLLILSIVIIILIIPMFCIPIKDNKSEKEDDYKYNIKSIYNYSYYSDSDDYNSKTYKLLGDDVYIICVYGPKAKRGGRGGKICGEYYFPLNATLNLTLGGREAGGKGGKNCGFFSKGNGNNGAGYTMVEYTNKFMVVAGGGGGNSENNIEGGDAECDGKGYYNGKGASKYKGGEGGDPSKNKENGAKWRGGDGVGKSDLNKFCGGGGGAGYYGGGAGDWGEKDNVGGGGGGSNHCDAEKCYDDGINGKYDYASIEIYKILKEKK